MGRLARPFAMRNRLFRTKSIEQLQASADDLGPGHGHLKRTLTAWDLTFMGVGAIIGAGILSSLGTGLAGGFDSSYGVTRPAAGPALMISFLLTAVACGFTAFCYAEMASMIPVSGSAYTYAYATLGELMAWIIGWDLLLEYAISNVAVAISWGSYANNLLQGMGLHLPGWLTLDSRTMLQVSEDFLKAHPDASSLPARLGYLAQAKSGALAGAAAFPSWDALSSAPCVGGFPIGMNLLAMLITIVITALCAWGIKESARFNNVIVFVKVVLLLGVIAIGAFYVKPANYIPFSPNGLKGIQAGAAIIFFAFIGFDAVSTTAEETRDPGRDLPRGILGSLAICTVIYVGVCAVVAGILPYAAYRGVADPIAHAFSSIGMNRVAGIVSVGAVAALSGALLVYQLAQPRIFMAMARDGLLPRWFARVGPRGTPLNATWVTGSPRRGPGRTPEHRRGRRAHEHRDALRVRARLPRRPHPARQAPGGASQVQDARRVAERAARNPLLPLARAGPAQAHVGALRDLARDRPRALLSLRHPPEPARSESLTGNRLSGKRRARAAVPA